MLSRFLSILVSETIQFACLMFVCIFFFVVKRATLSCSFLSST